ncbi:MAG: hypothetical protein K8I29_15035 [Alphaproteobacteria bacterium]|uniref:Nucleoside phosphorylase domain-containing protein n=1 Tax=Candidatus Nitrobium versatile TaxID=2884831 RepID=A0A953J753_9BACT|nr:hypothetical protein [Candidatus Nitrobium versatile]
MRIALLAAYPQELRYAVSELRAVAKNRHPFLWYSAKHLSLEIDLVQTGMGLHRARAALCRLLEMKTPDLVISVGFCGALYENAAIGDLIQGTRVLLCRDEGKRAFLPAEQQLLLAPGAAFPGAGIQGEIPGTTGGCIITLSRRVRKGELKKILTADMVAPVCDMETYALARLSQQRALPFLALRAVTDLHHEDIPEAFFGTVDDSGMYRTTRAFGLLLLRPGLIPSALRLGKASSLAAKNLWRGLRTVIETLS